MTTGDTLPHRLADTAARHPTRVAFTYLAEGEEPTENLTYGELDARARRVAGWLARRFPPGERVLLALPSDLGLLVAFFGCLYAGLVAVPVPPPRPRRDTGRFAAVAASARPAVVLTTADPRGRALAVGDGVASAVLDDAITAGDPWADPPAATPDDVAFLQNTSGSTADPRGVQLRHRHLTANEEAIRLGFGHGPETVVVGWLPLHHDMGLIGNALQTVYLGTRAVLMPPSAFAQQPARWLRAIDAHGGTTAGGPNFAYDLCARRVPPTGLDLSRWRVAYNGAEPIAAATLARFADTFAACGFDPAAFYPCYGLAEATLLVTGPPGPGTGCRQVRVTRAGLGVGYARPTIDADPDGVSVVGCGPPAHGVQVTVIDTATGRACPSGEVGEVVVGGACVADGYWDSPDATAAAFGPATVRTGDLGFLHAGELYVTGRRKDVVIVRGLKHFPDDIERAVGDCHPLVTGFRGVVLTAAGLNEQTVQVVQEVAPRTPADALPHIAAAVRSVLASGYGVHGAGVVLVRAGHLPVTTSGKPRRAATAERLRAGTLDGIVYTLPGETS